MQGDDDAAETEAEEIAYRLGGIGRSGDTTDLADLLRRGAQLGVVKVNPSRHELWLVEGGGVHFPVGAWGFTSRGFAWVCWLGMGSPPDAEIRLVVNPRVETETTFIRMGQEMESIQAPRCDVPAGPARAFRVIDGGRSGAGGRGDAPADDGGDGDRAPAGAGEGEGDLPAGPVDAQPGD